VFWPGFTYLLGFFFLFFYPLKLVTGFANVTSFKLKIITLFSTSTISLNLFMEIILSLSHDTFIVILTIYSFLSYRISITHRNVITSILCVVFYYYYYYYYLFLFTGVYKISPVVLIFCSGAWTHVPSVTTAWRATRLHYSCRSQKAFRQFLDF